MKRLHKYILSNFLSILAFSIVFMVLLFVLSDFFGHLSSFLKNSVGVYTLIKYYFYYTPFILYYLFPLVFALASLITLGFMSMRNEIIVMRASGINIFSISSPILFLAVFFGILMFLSGEYVVGKSLDRAYFIKTFEFDKNNGSDMWVKKKDMFINAGNIDIKNGVAYNVKIYKIDNNDIKEVIFAKKMKIEKNGVLLSGGYFINMKNITKKKTIKNMFLNIKIEKSDFVKSPEKNAYTISQVWKNIRTSKDKNYYEAIFMSKVFYPFSILVLTILSLVFVLKTTPRKSDFIKNVFLGGIFFIFYIGIFELLISMGKMSIIQPVLTISLFMLLWLTFSVYNLLKLGV